MNSLKTNPAVRILLILFAVYAGYQKLHGRKVGQGICMGNCTTHAAVGRTYQPDASEFKVAAPYDANGKTLAAVHTFKLGPMQTLKGSGFGYDLPANNDFGQDGEYFYLPPDRLAHYHSTYVKPGADCPASYMHQNARIYVLIGATPEISKQLRDFKFKIEYGGTPFAYEGHPMTYASSTADGEPSQLVPSQYASAFSNKGHANIQYDYFLVTGFATPDAPLENPENRQPAAAVNLR